MPFRRPTCLGSPENAGRQKAPLPPERNDLQVVKVQNADAIPESERGSCNVTLHKEDNVGLGLTISGGCDKEAIPKVTNMRLSGIAAMCDRLQVGDHIVSVNGIRTTKMKHAEIISLLKNVGETVMFNIEYHLPPTTCRTPTVVQKSTDVMLRKENGSFGFVLRGGPHENRLKCRSHVITHIRKESAADKNSMIKTGDRILSINSSNISNMTLDEVNKILDNADDLVRFAIEYDVSVMDAVATASGPLLVEVSKTPGSNLGLVLTQSTQRGKHVVCIEKVQPASIADRCGALRVYDQILSIDGVAVDGTTVSVLDASKLLQSASDNVRLEILPASQLSIEAPKYLSLNRFVPTIASTQSLSALNLFPTHPHRQQHFLNVSTLRDHGSHRRKKMQRPKYAGSAMSLSSVDYMSGNQVVHTEIINIRLLAADDQCLPGSPVRSCFGIQLQGGVFATELLSSPPAIGFIDCDSAAERSGRVQVGDRILSVNGCRTENESLEEVNRMLFEAMEMGQAYLELEFDVAESVVPSCGTFHVKLPKRRNTDLGIIIGTSGKTSDLEPLVIIEVKKGSQAHRTGTLQAGDRLLAIDGVRLRKGSTVEDAWALLQSAEDVVRLKIRKDEDNSDDAESLDSISFNVELKRYGGPLGITISGTEESFDPIVISGLAPGGLAYRTGAIHKGDQILSINSVSLRTKPLSEAISLLQTAGETVNLKIKKRNENDSLYSSAPDNVVAGQPMHSNSTSPATRFGIMTEAIDEQSDPDEPADDVQQPSPTVDANRLHGNIEPGLARVGPAGAASVEATIVLPEESAPSDGKSQFPQTVPPQRRKSEATSRPSFTSPRRVESLRARFESDKDLPSTAWGQRLAMRSCEIYPDMRGSRPVADWQNALLDLQSVGQSSDIMRDLEESILSENEFAGPSDTQRHQTIFQPERSYRGSDNVVSGGSTVQLHKITLQKMNEAEDYGFSLSDGQLERGVFVHSTRCDGPADRAGIKPYDRILQVNGIKTRDFDCCQAIPLIARGGRRIILVVARHPTNSAVSIMSHHSPLLAPPVEIPSAAVMHAGPYGTL